jgi:hypothetical protein
MPLPPVPAPAALDVPWWYELLSGFTTSDVVNMSISVMALLVGLGALVFAKQQVRLAKRQVVLAEQQGASAKRQEKLDKELSEITKEQHAIVKAQHALAQEQLSRRPKLSLGLIQVGAMASSSMQDVKFKLYVRNRGNKQCDKFTYTILVPFDSPLNVRVQNAKELGARTVEGMEMTQLVGTHSETVFPGRSDEVVQVQIGPLSPTNPEPVKLLYSISHADGREPPLDDTFRSITAEARPFKFKS